MCKTIHKALFAFQLQLYFTLKYNLILKYVVAQILFRESDKSDLPYGQRKLKSDHSSCCLRWQSLTSLDLTGREIPQRPESGQTPNRKAILTRINSKKNLSEPIHGLEMGNIRCYVSDYEVVDL